MKIENSSLEFKSTHQLTVKKESQESIQYWNKDTSLELSEKQDELHISALAQQLYESSLKLSSTSDSDSTLASVEPSNLTSSSAASTATSPTNKELLEPSDKDKMKLLMILMFLKNMKNMNGSIFKDDDFKSLALFSKGEFSKPASLILASSPQLMNKINTPQPQLQQGWGIDIQYHELQQEQEMTSFKTKGVINTQDGRSIAVSMSLMMSRSTTTEVNFSYKAGDAVKDPLVVNFDNITANLSKEKFSFDIDADGTAENVSLAGPGSGFLALDKNSDGKINNGQELFGAMTGQGFVELANYDVDKNNWIDENDPIFKDLKIWTKDQEGTDQIYDLKSLGIGAIYLGNTATPFTLKNSNEITDGFIKSTGLFLHENGLVGTIQQLDLTI